MNEIYLKIYMENGDTLVLEGQGNEDKQGYWPTRWDETTHRLGTVVVGAEHISITAEAKDAFKRIIKNAKRTGDDISCLDVKAVYRKIDGKFEEHPTNVCVSYLGDVVERFNVEEVINDEDFFIGCGEGFPDLSLLDKLVLAD